MNKKMGEEKDQTKGKVLTMPDQFQVMPLGDMLWEIMKEDFRQYCIERGINPDDIMAEWPDD